MQEAIAKGLLFLYNQNSNTILFREGSLCKIKNLQTVTLGKAWNAGAGLMKK